MGVRSAKDIAKEYTASYARYVASSRAIPDVIDGLKPVHRRCINSAYDLKLFHNKKFLKVAKLSGQVLGDYHPHGGASMIILAQPFKTRYPLFEGQGNFGCPDSPNSVAAERYIETRLTKFCEDFYLESADYADKEDNYDGRLKEITRYYPVLPGSLFTGASGIAVGFSTNIPTHTISDVGKSLLAYIKGRDCLSNIMPETCEESIIVTDKSDIKKLYEKGEGSIRYRAKTHYETIDGKPALVVDAFPPDFSKKKLEAPFILEAVEKGDLDLYNESAEGIRYVFVSSDRDLLESILEKLETSVSYRLYMEHRGVIHQYTLSEIYDTFIEEKSNYLIRKYSDLASKNYAEIDYINVLLLLKKDKDYIKEIIDMSSEEAVKGIMSRYNTSEEIAKRLLSVSLRSLTKDNIKLVEERLKLLKKDVESYESFVNDPLSKIVSDIKSFMKEFSNDKRRATHVTEQLDSFNVMYKGDSVEFHKDMRYLVGTSDNQISIMYGEAINHLSDIDDKFIVPLDKEFYVFYDKQGICAVKKDIIELGVSKFKSDELSGIVATDSLEEVSFMKSNSKTTPIFLGEWALRQRLSYVRLVDGDSEINLRT